MLQFKEKQRMEQLSRLYDVLYGKKYPNRMKTIIFKWEEWKQLNEHHIETIETKYEVDKKEKCLSTKEE